VSRFCLFCPNPVDSAEHLWSDWILEDLKLATSVRITIGKSESTWVDDPEIKIKCVCSRCNNGWMSKLEEANQLQIHAMINDDPCGLGKRDQNKLVFWAILKAMVVDSVNPNRSLFYTQDERIGLKNSSEIPSRTLVWLGRYHRKGFHAGGTDIWGEIDKVPKAAHGCVTTFIMGHLVLQTFTLHVPTELRGQNVNIGCKMGDWRTNLLDIWPTTNSLRWPPNLTFTSSGPAGIATVIGRWRIGEDVG